MHITFDPVKSERNIVERGLSFDLVYKFDFETAVFSVDVRHSYGEIRMRALGLMTRRVHALVFVETDTGIRIISLRKANKREVKHYEQETQS